MTGPWHDGHFFISSVNLSPQPGQVISTTLSIMFQLYIYTIPFIFILLGFKLDITVASREAETCVLKKYTLLGRKRACGNPLASPFFGMKIVKIAVQTQKKPCQKRYTFLGQGMILYYSRKKRKSQRLFSFLLYFHNCRTRSLYGLPIFFFIKKRAGLQKNESDRHVKKEEKEKIRASHEENTLIF